MLNRVGRSWKKLQMKPNNIFKYLLSFCCAAKKKMFFISPASLSILLVFVFSSFFSKKDNTFMALLKKNFCFCWRCHPPTFFTGRSAPGFNQPSDPSLWKYTQAENHRRELNQQITFSASMFRHRDPPTQQTNQNQMSSWMGLYGWQDCVYKMCMMHSNLMKLFFPPFVSPQLCVLAPHQSNFSCQVHFRIDISPIIEAKVCVNVTEH